jgi:hypothetical protein
VFSCGHVKENLLYWNPDLDGFFGKASTNEEIDRNGSLAKPRTRYESNDKTKLKVT